MNFFRTIERANFATVPFSQSSSDHYNSTHTRQSFKGSFSFRTPAISARGESRAFFLKHRRMFSPQRQAFHIHVYSFQSYFYLLFLLIFAHANSFNCIFLNIIFSKRIFFLLFSITSFFNFIFFFQRPSFSFYLFAYVQKRIVIVHLFLFDVVAAASCFFLDMIKNGVASFFFLQQLACCCCCCCILFSF